MIIYWHKKDYRLLDNQALTYGLKLACLNNTFFVPIMGIESDLDNYEFGTFQKAGIINAIIPLYNNYRHHGVQPFMYNNSVIEVLRLLNNHEKITHIVSHQEHGTTFTYNRDKLISEYCKKNNIIWHQIQPSSIVRNLNSRDNRDRYWKEYINASILPIPNFNKVRSLNLEDQYDDICNLQAELQIADYQFQPTSERLGLLTLQDFVNNRAVKYRGSISSPNTAILYGSRLSQYITYGSLSVRYIVQTFVQKIKSSKLIGDKRTMSGLLEAMTRLHWREHFIQRIEDEHALSWQAINLDYNNIIYANKPEHIASFTTGHTGEPLIDACIRCLNQTGFINFRMRAMLVSYATFALDIDWRIIGQILASKFYDYEPGIHWSQVQMQAGITGINMIRVYSPKKQLLDQDPQAIFVKQWVLELLNISVEDIMNYNKVSLYDLTHGQYINPICDTSECIKKNKAKVFELKKNNKTNAQKVFVKHGSRKNKKSKRKEKNPSHQLI